MEVRSQFVCAAVHVRMNTVWIKDSIDEQSQPLALVKQWSPIEWSEWATVYIIITNENADSKSIQNDTKSAKYSFIIKNSKPSLYLLTVGIYQFIIIILSVWRFFEFSFLLNELIFMLKWCTKHLLLLYLRIYVLIMCPSCTTQWYYVKYFYRSIIM